VNRERLKLVIEALEATDDRAFNMATWAIKTDCGTVGCAVSQYIAKNEGCGLSLVFHSFDNRASVRAANGSESYSAISWHFNIQEILAKCLFDPQEYPTPYAVTRQQVIDRIREFIGEDPAPVVELKAQAMATVPG
jgi:hypothetical protein